MSENPQSPPQKIFMLGATGTIGQAVVRTLVERGHEVTCFVRPKAGRDSAGLSGENMRLFAGTTLRFGDVTRAESLIKNGFRGEKFDILVSCMASRTGISEDAWAIDHDAHITALTAARAAGVSHMVLLSAICVQKPLLAFQHAKLAFEKALMDSGLTYSIVRPTAFFKSLSGQVDRIRRGKPYLLFGDGHLTACKPISDDDLGQFISECIDDPNRHNRILPIGGPGDAITPKQQGEKLFALLGRAPRFRHVPVSLLDAIIAVLGLVGHIIPAAKKKAELARIGRYYATESMLVLNGETGRYDADATPSAGCETLFDFYAELIKDEASVWRGDHTVF